MKKIRNSLLFVSGVLFLSSCSTSTAGSDVTTVTLWYWNRSLSDEVIKEVESEFPGVTINAQKIGGDEYKTKLHTSLIAESGPDIVAMNDWVFEYLPYEEEFVNLYDYGAAEVEDDYLDWKWNLAEAPESNALIALPIDTGPTVLYYRADLFEEAGLPSEPEEVAEKIQSWDDYIEAGRQLKEELDVYMFDNLERTYLQYLEQQSDKYFTEEEEFIGDGGTVRDAWDNAMKVHEESMTARINDGERNAALSNGSIASFIGAVWEAGILKDAAADTAGNWRVTHAPGGAGNNGGSFLGVLQSSEHKELAAEITMRLVSKEAQERHYLDVDLFPSTIETIESTELAEPDPFFGDQVVMDVFASAATEVPSTYYGELYMPVREFFNEELALVERANKDPEQAWQDAQTKVQRELSRHSN
ncbi:ABC transporter substrate-binding protein [Alkalicoccobacillus porphyridii]|uniref:Carbohydrate ABC transporter substrate-binding protein n=1 Tax=Alkalicoccobacillus porphyridii TaxID=2597270 RepID=A0A553ZUI7_9BACI|nr:ABC transporter substrate-binding protein [Alkalicoccobacillus porphyridii]TSB45117.1 carbohydrate ABC transporter substrate-binding protein [Alkalicoccobacillus porphyridii]